MKPFFLLLVVILILSCVGTGGKRVIAQSPTDTPTPTNTPTQTDTPTATSTNTPTPTETPNLYYVATVSSGQAVAVVYTVNGGESVIFGELVIVILLLGFIAFLMAIRR